VVPKVKRGFVVTVEATLLVYAADAMSAESKASAALRPGRAIAADVVVESTPRISPTESEAGGRGDPTPPRRKAPSISTERTTKKAARAARKR
jgi:hypothetical protein